MHKKWEHKKVIVEWYDIDYVIKTEGLDGWELCATTAIKLAGHQVESHFLYFKREIIEDQENK